MLLSSLLMDNGSGSLLNGKSCGGEERKVQMVFQAYTRSECGLGIGCKFVDSLSDNQLSDILFIDFVVQWAIKLRQGL